MGAILAQLVTEVAILGLIRLGTGDTNAFVGVPEGLVTALASVCALVITHDLPLVRAGLAFAVDYELVVGATGGEEGCTDGVRFCFSYRDSYCNTNYNDYGDDHNDYDASIFVFTLVFFLFVFLFVTVVLRALRVFYLVKG